MSTRFEVVLKLLCSVSIVFSFLLQLAGVIMILRDHVNEGVISAVTAMIMMLMAGLCHLIIRRSSMSGFMVTCLENDVHTFTQGDGKEYDVYKLIHLTSGIPVTTMTTAELEQMIEGDVCWEDGKGFWSSPQELLERYRRLGDWKAVAKSHPSMAGHINRVITAECKYPILIHQGKVVDGMHRIVRACVEKHKSVPVKVIEDLPEEAVHS